MATSTATRAFDARVEDGWLVIGGRGERAAPRHLLWLRDACSCELCVDPHSSQRHADSADLPASLGVRSLSVTPDGGIAIVWDPDGHASTYDARTVAGWQAPHRPFRWTLWAHELQGAVPRADHAAVVSDPRAMYRWLASIRDLGVSVLANTPVRDSEVERVAELFGHVHEGNDGRHFEVIATPNPVNFAYTPKSLALHTDRPFADPVPGIQFLHCLKQSEAGGENILVDGFWAADRLRQEEPEAFATLVRVPATFRNRYMDVDLRTRRPVIALDADGHVEAIHVNDRAMRPVEAEGQDVPAFYRSYRALVATFRRPQAQVTLKLAVGDALVFNNRRVLHGRSGYDASKTTRHLQGCYADWCGLQSKLRMLAGELGLDMADAGLPGADRPD